MNYPGSEAARGDCASAGQFPVNRAGGRAHWNLDSKTGEEIMALFANLHGQGNTIILVTHEHDIAQHAHRIIFIRDGKIASDEQSRRSSGHSALSFHRKLNNLSAWAKRESVAHGVFECQRSAGGVERKSRMGLTRIGCATAEQRRSESCCRQSAKIRPRRRRTKSESFRSRRGCPCGAQRTFPLSQAIPVTSSRCSTKLAPALPWRRRVGVTSVS